MLKILSLIAFIFSILCFLSGLIFFIKPTEKNTRKNALITVFIGIVIFSINNAIVPTIFGEKKDEKKYTNVQIVNNNNDYTKLINFIKKDDSKSKIKIDGKTLEIKFNSDIFSEKTTYEVYTTQAGKILDFINKNRIEFSMINIVKPVSLVDGGESNLINCNFYIDDYKKVDWDKIMDLSASSGWYKFYINATSFNIDKSILNSISAEELEGLKFNGAIIKSKKQ